MADSRPSIILRTCIFKPAPVSRNTTFGSDKQSTPSQKAILCSPQKIPLVNPYFLTETSFRRHSTMGIIFSAISQAFPPKPTFTEKDIGNLSGKVHILPSASRRKLPCARATLTEARFTSSLVPTQVSAKRSLRSSTLRMPRSTAQLVRGRRPRPQLTKSRQPGPTPAGSSSSCPWTWLT